MDVCKNMLIFQNLLWSDWKILKFAILGVSQIFRETLTNGVSLWVFDGFCHTHKFCGEQLTACIGRHTSTHRWKAQATSPQVDDTVGRTAEYAGLMQ